MINLKEKIRSVPDFPVKGITFRDITPLMNDVEGFQFVCESFYNRYKDRKIDKVVGIDARGFIFGSVLAYLLKVGFVPVRKKGKLPHKTLVEEYALEYGRAEVEIHEDAICKGDKVIIMDDLIATGGTIAAAVRLVEKLKGVVAECAFVVELSHLKGRDLIKEHSVFALIDFAER